MNGYKLGYAVGTEKEAIFHGRVLGGLGKWVAKRFAPAIKPKGIFSKAVPGLPGRAGVRAGRGRQIAGFVKRHPLGIAETGLAAYLAPDIYREVTRKPATQAETQAEYNKGLQDIADELERRRGAAAGTDIWSRLKTPIALGQTGLKFSPLYGLLGGAAGLGLGALAGGREEDEEGRPRRRSLLTNPLVLALLLGAGGGLLPSMMGGAGKGEAA